MSTHEAYLVTCQGCGEEEQHGDLHAIRSWVEEHDAEHADRPAGDAR